ncbi:MAG: CDP-diacylglycerol--serine O-phosphatidyltransferase [Candidatus Cloacimonas sp. 4484_209]|nr:MAG: CDP-diacylglycerol--serine O-phosphatidyltransferase [Candidatus Cloacimonas sp. 4484_209]
MNKRIYILPNLFTTASIVTGFYSILAAVRENFILAGWFVVLAVVFDSLDGAVARLTHSQSAFGMEYDSLSDLVSFGVAPAFISYMWYLRYLDEVGLFLCIAYLLTGALRLARFNVQSKRISFVGLPIPAAAMMVVSTMFITIKFNIHAGSFFVVLFILVSFLMISNVRYKGLKHINLNGFKWWKSLSLVPVFIFFLWKPYFVLFLLSVVYIFSGPVECMVKVSKRRFLGRREDGKQKDNNI